MFYDILLVKNPYIYDEVHTLLIFYITVAATCFKGGIWPVILKQGEVVSLGALRPFKGTEGFYEMSPLLGV